VFIKEVVFSLINSRILYIVYEDNYVAV